MLVKIFTVTKNEYDLIEEWIRFYGTIFGYENLVVIDNGSTDEKTLKIYEKFSKKVNIYKEDSYEKGKQGDHFTKYMSREKQNCDFLLGCDTDNFLLLKDKDTINKDDYISFFKNLPKEQNKFLIHSSYDVCNIDTNNSSYNNSKLVKPTDHTIFYKHASVCINFFRSKNFIKTHNGNHFSITSPDQNPYNITGAFMVHYNYTGIKRIEEKSIQIVEGYNYMKVLYPLYYHPNTVKNFECIKNILNDKSSRNGIHRIRELFIIFLIYLLINLINKFSFDNNKEDLFIKVLYNKFPIINIFRDIKFIEDRLLYTEETIVEKIKEETKSSNCKDKLTIQQIYTLFDSKILFRTNRYCKIDSVKNFLKI